MSSKINLQTCEYARKSSIFQDNQLIWSEIIIDYIILPAVIVGLGFILYGQFKYNKGIF